MQIQYLPRIGRRTAAFMLAALLAGTTAWPGAAEPADDSPAVTATTDDPDVETTPGDRLLTYEEYAHQYAEQEHPTAEIRIEAADYTRAEGARAAENEQYAGRDLRAVYTGETGYIEWTVTIPETGLYSLSLLYRGVADASDTILRTLSIDGVVPFGEAAELPFRQVWQDDPDSWATDSRGNQLLPAQQALPEWQEVFLRDASGYYNEPLAFYFIAGVHTLRLTAVARPMVVGWLRLHQNAAPPTYAEVQAGYADEGYTDTTGVLKTFEAERMYQKNDSTIVPIEDRTSPYTTPYDVAKIRLNTMGADRWNKVGQSVTWEIEAPEDGLYTLAFRARQNLVSGVFVTRRVSIDGAVPFRELEGCRFVYDAAWQVVRLGDGETPYRIYLTKGTHTLTMEVTLGDMAALLRTAQASTLALNTIYRKIIMLTGTDPDRYRDYRLKTALPEMLTVFEEQAAVLEGLDQTFEKVVGSRGSANTILRTLAIQLRDFHKDPDSVPTRLTNFKTNIGALGAWVLSLQAQPLELDKIYLLSPDEALPEADAGFFGKAKHEIGGFLSTFVEDYNWVGGAEGKAESIDVWIQTGRDQAEIISSLITNRLAPTRPYGVNLKLVQGQLLMATISGKGPDVALQVGGSEPINYALRGAVTGLGDMPGFDEVAGRFRDSALVPFRYAGDTYALPETQTFSMLFYRQDVLAELGLTPPDNWEQAVALIAELQKKNLEFGIPVSTSAAAAANNMQSMGLFLFQKGGQFYTDDGKASALDSPQAIAAFQEWTNLFTSYKLPVSYDAANRFRTGEMPVLIADFGFYNSLNVIAPEIRGLWTMQPVPGTPQPDGTLDRSVPGAGTACMVLAHCDNQEAAWDFLSWWTSADIQSAFGRAIENRLGSSARYATANVEAFADIPWNPADMQVLASQWPWVKGIPEVPGGYFTSRHLENAFRKVLYSTDDPRETLLDYVQVINQEIAFKRGEFHLDDR